jgi:hypothetical protein
VAHVSHGYGECARDTPPYNAVVVAYVSHGYGECARDTPPYPNSLLSLQDLVWTGRKLVLYFYQNLSPNITFYAD